MQAVSHILGTGFYVPPKVVTNDDLATRFDTSDEWIQQRTGIKERRYSTVEDPPGVMGAKASRKAIADAGLEVSDIDAIILGTLSPDNTFPGSSVIVQELLDLPGIPAMDVRNQCTGLLYSLATADAWIRAGLAKNILVIGAEVHSTGIDFHNDGRDVTVLFGDGAAALVVGPTPDPNKGLLCHKLHADGRGRKHLWLEYPSSGHFPFRAPQEMYETKSVYPQMDGSKVFKTACRKLPEVIAEVLAETGYSLDDIDVLVPHQANMRINEMVAKLLKFPPEKVVHNIQKYGNTTAASVGIALHEAREDGRIQDGSLVMLAAFGSGFTWAASLVRFLMSKRVVRSLAVALGCGALLALSPLGCKAVPSLAKVESTGSTGAILPASWGMLAVERVSMPRGLENDRLIDLMDAAYSTSRACGRRIEALEARSNSSRLTPGRLAIGGLMSGIIFGAASGLMALVPDESVRQKVGTAVGVAGASTGAIVAGLGIAATANPARGYDRRIGAIQIAFEEFMEDWGDTVSGTEHACRMDGADPSGRWGTSRYPITGGLLGGRCLVVPDQNADEAGPGWSARRAETHFGPALDGPRCVLSPERSDRLEAALRSVVQQFEGRCTGVTDDVDPPATPSPSYDCL